MLFYLMAKQPKKICIVGSQEHTWSKEGRHVAKTIIYDLIEREMHNHVLFISGECPKGGVDIWVKEICEQELFAPYKGYPPEKNNYTYYKKRNIQMAQDCTMLYCIRSSKSRTKGSYNTALMARKMGKKVMLITIGEM